MEGAAVLALAVRIGRARLIDNRVIKIKRQERGGRSSIKAKIRWRDSLRRDFLAGLLVFLPVAITLWFIGWVIGLLDSVLEVLPDAFHPNSTCPFRFPD